MKKLISILVLLVLVALGLWAGSTYWFGLKAEEQYRALLQQASESQYVKFVNTSYQRRFCQSQAQTVVDVRLPSGTAGESQTFKIPLIQEITHGPFPFGKLPASQPPWQPVMAVIETRLAPGSELQSGFSELLTQIPELAALRDYTVLHLDGKGEERLVVPAFQHTFGKEDPVAVTWNGLSLQADFSTDFKALSGSFAMPGSEARSKELGLRLGEVKAAFTTNAGPSGLWLGDASCSLANLEVTQIQDSGTQSLLIEGFSANTATKAAGDNINSVVALRTQLVKLDGTQYGPGIFEIEFRNFDAVSLARLQESLREEQAQAGQEGAEAGEMKNLAKYMEILPNLLKKSPEIEIKQCDLKTSLGDFTGKARIAIDGSKAGAVQNLLTLPTALTARAEIKIAENLLRSAFTAMSHGDVVAELEELEGESFGEEDIDELVAARVDEQLAALTAQNILVKEDGTYASSVLYEGGQFVLNGRPLNLQDLMQ